MKYELCKKLKGNFELSELIEACGENIRSIDFIRDINLVVAYSGSFEGIKGEGSTPEIAVANLWLELNKK